MTPLIESASGDTFATAFATTIKAIRRSTVQVRGVGPGGGAGVIWRADGLIITNAHVVRGDEATVELWDGRVLSAKVIAKDTEEDLAALQVAATDLPAAPIGDSSTLRVGEFVLAVGNPFGRVGAVTSGIIHTVAHQDSRRGDWVQADITLAPGNSGGPLTNAAGQVIGINSMIAGGLGLAIPSKTVERFLQRQQRRAPLGVTLRPVAYNNTTVGMLVLEVATGSVADAAGVLIGDIVIGIGGTQFSDPRAFMNAVRRNDDATLRVNIVRGGQPQEVSLQLIAEQAAA